MVTEPVRFYEGNRCIEDKAKLFSTQLNINLNSLKLAQAGSASRSVLGLKVCKIQEEATSMYPPKLHQKDQYGAASARFY